jgi:hypothetical protein
MLNPNLNIALLSLLLTLPTPILTSPPPQTNHHYYHYPPKPCPALAPGDHIATHYQLYPENAVCDPLLCRLWLGSVFNATAVLYNPYTAAVESVLAVPGISLTADVHIGGIAWDPYSSSHFREGNNKGGGKGKGKGKGRHLVSILANSARPWVTAGADVSGERELIRWDVERGQVEWRVDVTSVSGGRYGGFQDVEHDRWGRTYVVGTWPGTILRVGADGKGLREWLVPEPLPATTVKGWSGLAVVRETGGETMLAVDGDGGLYRFELREREDTGRPVRVPMQPEVLYNDTDAIYLPPMYGGKVLLVASLFNGVQVLRSKDRLWRTAEYLGTIPIPTGGLYEGGNTVAAVQMGRSSVFMVIGFIFDEWVPGTVAGNRTRFPFPDITDEIDTLLRR